MISNEDLKFIFFNLDVAIFGQKAHRNRLLMHILMGSVKSSDQPHRSLEISCCSSIILSPKIAQNIISFNG